VKWLRAIDPFDFAQGRLSIAYRWKLERRAPSRPHEIVGRFCETPLYGSASDTDALQIFIDCC